jgi:hypothetical protein
MKIEIVKKWAIEDVKKNYNNFFIYEDNHAKIGGPNSIRELENTLALRTKRGPSNKPAAYLNDSDFLHNCKVLREDILLIRSKLIEGKTVVFLESGYGQESKLEQYAPQTFDFLSKMLKRYFNFDNFTGKRWYKIPGYDEMNLGKYIDFSKNNLSIIQPINNSFFEKRLLENNLVTTYDLIKTQNKTSFLSTQEYKIDEILIFVFEISKEYLVCRVIDSYSISNIDLSLCYKTEGYNKDFKFVSDGLFQIQLEYISTLESNGNMIYKDDFFSNKNLPEGEKKIAGEKYTTNIDMKNDEVLEILKDLKDRIEKIENKKFFKNPFRKSIEKLLSDKKIVGEIKKINYPNYQVKTENEYILVKLNEGLIFNSIEIILTSKTPFQ